MRGGKCVKTAVRGRLTYDGVTGKRNVANSFVNHPQRVNPHQLAGIGREFLDVNCDEIGGIKIGQRHGGHARRAEQRRQIGGHDATDAFVERFRPAIEFINCHGVARDLGGELWTVHFRRNGNRPDEDGVVGLRLAIADGGGIQRVKFRRRGTATGGEHCDGGN